MVTDQNGYAAPMNGSILVIHVLNKNSIGGAETLVASLVNGPQTVEGQLMHKTILIAPNKISIQLLRMKLLRLLPIFTTSVRVTIVAIQSNLSGRKTAFIFHLAECHLVAKICGPIISNLTNIRILIYLHQSRELYPAKIRRVTDSLVGRYESICYSEFATKSWFAQSASQIPRRTIIHNPVAVKCPRYRDTKGKTLKLIFIGRFTPWKRPDLAIAIASQLATLTPVEMKVVGFNKSDFVDHYGDIKDSTASLSINFLGPVHDVAPLVQDSDLLLNLAESTRSGESIGIAALECLSLGVPVLVQDSKMSDFQNLPGIYSLIDFENVFKKMFQDPQPALLFRSSFKISPMERVTWEKKTSLERYNYELSLLLVKFFEERR